MYMHVTYTSSSSSSGAVFFKKVGCHYPPWLLILSQSHDLFISHSRPLCDICHPLRSWPSSAYFPLQFLTFRRRLPVRGSGSCRDLSSFSVSGPFLLDVPGFQVPSDIIVPPQLWSSSRALSLHLHFCNCSDVFSFTSSFDVSKPFQPSPSHNRHYRFHLCFFQDLLISPVF